MSMELMVRILKEVELSRPQQGVLVAMAENAWDDGTHCFPSVDLIAWKSGYKPRNVTDVIRQLKTIGVIQEVRPAAGRRATEYVIRLENAPCKQSFEDWKSQNGRHKSSMNPTDNDPVEVHPGVNPDSVEVQSHVKSEGVQFDEGCNLTSRGVQSHVSGVQSHVTTTREIAPEPVREPVIEPVREPVNLARAKSGPVLAPEAMTITPEMRTQAISYGVEPDRIDAETETFLDHHRARGNKFSDWSAAWRSWMRRVPQFTPRVNVGNVTTLRPKSVTPANVRVHDPTDNVDWLGTYGRKDGAPA